ncbi:ribose ABC transporter permease [Iocasia frigidifontis]|uniref:Ribose ABC transporter permease n=1 Tax=Iocasia fonsfrigidae TaxID=2682810 RepID=A0A8A7KBN9_9FIRM|nr:ribose ABC transporter permease [Iocasia fonsfrigidae]QTL99216.1 ribose ABC transporter permease [Iocasia fonsfrigidae]
MEEINAKNPKINSNIFRELSSLIGLIVLCTILAIISPAFLSVTNILNVLVQVAVISVIAAGSTFVILTGGIDLSVGSILGLCGVMTAAVLKSTGNPLLAVLTGVLLGAFLGLVNGVVISIGKVPAFVTTLGMMSVARGIAFIYTRGRPISGFPDGFRYIGSGYIGDIPFPVIEAIIIFLIAAYVLKKTPFGRYVYAIGSNEVATKLSGIKTNKYKIMVYAISGLLSGFAAIMFIGRINSGHPLAGDGYELDAIAAVVIGGTSLSGGKGTVFGTLIGALIMGVIRNGLNLLNVDAFWQGVVLGVVIVVAVLIDQRSKKTATI